MKKKDSIKIQISAYGKTVVMHYDKDSVLEDYKMYIIGEMLQNKTPKSIRFLIKKKMVELLGEVINNENSHLHWRY